MSKKIIIFLMYLGLLILVINFAVISEPAPSKLPAPPKLEQGEKETESQAPVNVINPISQLAKEDITGNNFWNLVAQIEASGNDNLVEIRNGLQNSDVKVRVGCAKVMYQLGYRQEAVKIFKAILVSGSNVDNQVFFTTAELLGNLVANDGGGEDIDKNILAKEIQSIMDETLEAKHRLSLAKLWFDLSKSSLAIREIRDIANLKDPEVRLSAALVLASIDQFEKSKDILKQLALDPTPSGRLAKTFLKYKELQDAYVRSRNSSKANIDYSLLDEIIGLIQNLYVDPADVDIKKLINAAAAGMGSSLDRFTMYEDEKQTKHSQESITSKYGGIGAYVSMRNDFLTIERPMYGQPAYKAGLRALDRITEVEGESTHSKTIDYLITKLKGDPGTPVKIKVYRRGWVKEREFTLVRAIVNVPTARYEILPGNIGFLSITSFSTNTAAETKQCLEEMKYYSVKAIIVDVRGNPGGLLSSVTTILDLFIEKDKTLVTTRDKNTVVEEFKTKDDNKIDVPVYVLINEGSASASEIFSGVLQDYHKAVLIGETTYGKGSVQRVFPIDTTAQKTGLRLTIAKYFLPSGRSIHKGKDGKGGVEPDIKIAASEQDLGKASEFGKLLDSGSLDKYSDEYYSKDKELFYALAEDDGESYERYPNFEQFYQESKARLEKDEVRQALREHIRRKVADEREKEFLVDIQIDSILQRAIIEACRSPQVNIVPENIPAYKNFVRKFDKDKENPVK
ncbi:MAG: S41 family peptidase [Planctomycetota bacterium]